MNATGFGIYDPGPAVVPPRPPPPTNDQWNAVLGQLDALDTPLGPAADECRAAGEVG